MLGDLVLFFAVSLVIDSSTLPQLRSGRSGIQEEIWDDREAFRGAENLLLFA
jgi:hypothetical protein